MRHSLVYRQGASDKFWRVSVEGRRVVVRFGRAGTPGQEQQTLHGSPADAQAAADRQAAAKLRKGYTRARAEASAPAGAEARAPAAGAARANRVLSRRVTGLLGRAPRLTRYTDLRERLTVAWACLAIGDEETASALARPVMDATGSDPQLGDTLDWQTRAAIALLFSIALRRRDAKAMTALRRRFDATRKVLLRGFKPAVVDRGVSAGSARRSFKRLATETVGFALYSADEPLGAIACALVRAPKDRSLLALLDEGLDALRARVSPAPRAAPAPRRTAAERAAPGQDGLSPDALEHRAAAEPNAVLAERLRALAWHLRIPGQTEYAHALATRIAAGFLALGRADDARRLARGVVDQLGARRGGQSKVRTHALALLLRLGGDGATQEAFDSTNYYRDVQFRRAGDFWKESLPEQLSEASVEELAGKRLHPAIAELGDAVGLLATCLAARPRNVALPRVERHLDRLLRMLRGRLTSGADISLARSLSALARRPPTLAPLPAAFDPKKERHPVVRRLKERVARRPGLRSSDVVLDALTIAACAWARDGDRAALDALEAFVGVPYVGDYGVWYPQGMAIALHAALGGRPSYVARVEADPFNSLDDAWLERKAQGLRAFVQEAAGLAGKRPTERALRTVTSRLGWAAIARTTTLLGRHATRDDAAAAWRAAKDALAAMLAR